MPNGHEKNTPWTWVLNSLATALFIIVWVGTQWLIHWIFKNLPLEGLDVWLGIYLQVSFGIATFVPVIIWLYREFGVMFYRARRDVRAARNEFENEGSEDEG